MRLSKIKAAKQLDFSKSVSDKTIFKSLFTDSAMLWQAKFFNTYADIRNIMSGVILGVREVLVIILYKDFFGRKGKICSTF